MALTSCNVVLGASRPTWPGREAVQEDATVDRGISRIYNTEERNLKQLYFPSVRPGVKMVISCSEWALHDAF